MGRCALCWIMMFQWSWWRGEWVNWSIRLYLIILCCFFSLTRSCICQFHLFVSQWRFFCVFHWWSGNDPCCCAMSPLTSGHLDSHGSTFHTDGPFRVSIEKDRRPANAMTSERLTKAQILPLILPIHSSKDIEYQYFRLIFQFKY